MAFGLSIVNDAGGLTFSSDAWHPVFLGRASLAYIVNPVTSGDTTEAGYGVYTFNHPAQIVPVVALTPGYVTRLIDFSYSGGTWTIRVANVSGSGFGTQAATVVYVFGIPTSASGWGLSLYRSNGALSSCLSSRPLWFKRMLSFTSEYSLSTGTSLAAPAIVGMTNDMRRVRSGTMPNADVYLYDTGWTISSDSSSLSRAWWARMRIYPLDANPPSVTTLRPATCFLLDASGL